MKVRIPLLSLLCLLNTPLFCGETWLPDAMDVTDESARQVLRQLNQVNILADLLGGELTADQPVTSEQETLHDLLLNIEKKAMKDPWRLNKRRFVEAAFEVIQETEALRVTARELYDLSRNPFDTGPSDADTFTRVSARRALDALELLGRAWARSKLEKTADQDREKLLQSLSQLSQATQTIMLRKNLSRLSPDLSESLRGALAQQGSSDALDALAEFSAAYSDYISARFAAYLENQDSRKEVLDHLTLKLCEQNPSKACEETMEAHLDSLAYTWQRLAIERSEREKDWANRGIKPPAESDRITADHLDELLTFIAELKEQGFAYRTLFQRLPGLVQPDPNGKPLRLELKTLSGPLEKLHALIKKAAKETKKDAQPNIDLIVTEVTSNLLSRLDAVHAFFELASLVEEDETDEVRIAIREIRNRLKHVLNYTADIQDKDLESWRPTLKEIGSELTSIYALLEPLEMGKGLFEGNRDLSLTLKTTRVEHVDGRLRVDVAVVMGLKGQTMTTGFVFENRELPIVASTDLMSINAQYRETLKEMLAEAQTKATDAQSLALFFKRMGIPESWEIEAEALSLRGGIDLKAWGQPLRITFGSASNTGHRVEVPLIFESSDLKQAIERILLKVLQKNQAALQDKLTPLGETISSMGEDLSTTIAKLPMTFENGRVIWRFTPGRLNSELFDEMNIEVILNRDGTLDINLPPPDFDQVLRNALGDNPFLMVRRKDEKRVVFLKQQGKPPIQIGSYRRTDGGFLIENRRLRFDFGGGFELLLRGDLHWENNGLRLDNVSLISNPLGLDVRIRGRLHQDPENGLRFQIDQQSPDSRQAPLEAFISKSLGVAIDAYGVRITDLYLDKAGLHPELEIDNEAIREDLRALTRTIDTAYRDTLASQKQALDRVIETYKGLIGQKFTRFTEILQENLGARNLRDHIELSPGTILDYHFKEGGRICDVTLSSDILDCGDLLRVRYQVDQEPNVLELNKDCILQPIKASLEGLNHTIEELQAQIDPSNYRFQVAFQITFTDDFAENLHAQLTLTIGLDGTIDFDDSDLLDAAKALAQRKVESHIRERLANAGLKKNLDELEQTIKAKIDQLEEMAGIEIEDYHYENPIARFTLLMRKIEVNGRPLKIRNLRFSLDRGLDFSGADCNLVTGRIKIEGLDAANLEIGLTQSLLSDAGATFDFRWRMQLPFLAEDVDGTLQLRLAWRDSALDLDMDGGLLSGKGQLLTYMARDIQQRLGGQSVQGQGFTLRFGEAKTNSPQNDTLILTGQAVVMEDPHIEVPFDLVIPVFRSGSPSLKVEPTTPIFAGLLNQLTDKAEISFSDKFDIKLKDISTVPGDHGIPEEIVLTVQATFYGYSFLLPTIHITDGHVSMGRFTGFEIPIPGFFITMGPVVLEIESITLAETGLSINGAVSPGGAKEALKLDCRLTISFEEPGQIEAVGNLYLFSFLNLGNSRVFIDIPEKYMETTIDLGGQLAAVISISGEVIVDLDKEQVIIGNLDGELLSVPVAKMRTKIDLDEKRILADARLNLIVEEVNFHASTEKNLSRPRLMTETTAFKLGGFKLGGTSLSLNPKAARFGCEVLGIRLGVVLPSYDSLDRKTIEDLLKRLLSPDLANLDKALAAILSGNFNINPLASFGTGDGGVGDSSSGGDNDADGEGEGEGSTSGDYSQAADGQQSSEKPPGTGEDPGPVAQDHTGRSQTTRPKLQSAGEYEYVIKEKDHALWLHEKHANAEKMKQMFRWVSQIQGDKATVQKVEMFHRQGDRWNSNGVPLLAGYLRKGGYYAHALDQELGGGRGVIYWLASKAPATDATVGRVAMAVLGLSYDQLNGLDAQTQSLFKQFLNAAPARLSPGKLDVLQSFSTFPKAGGTYSLGSDTFSAWRANFVGDAFATVPISAQIGGQQQEKTALIAGLNQLAKREDHERVFAQLLRELLNREQARAAQVFLAEDQLFAVVQRDLMVYREGAFHFVEKLPELRSDIQERIAEMDELEVAARNRVAILKRQEQAATERKPLLNKPGSSQLRILRADGKDFATAQLDNSPVFAKIPIRDERQALLQCTGAECRSAGVPIFSGNNYLAHIVPGNASCNNDGGTLYWHRRDGAMARIPMNWLGLCVTQLDAAFENDPRREQGFKKFINSAVGHIRPDQPDLIKPGNLRHFQLESPSAGQLEVLVASYYDEAWYQVYVSGANMDPPPIILSGDLLLDGDVDKIFLERLIQDLIEEVEYDAHVINSGDDRLVVSHGKISLYQGDAPKKELGPLRELATGQPVDIRNDRDRWKLEETLKTLHQELLRSDVPNEPYASISLIRESQLFSLFLNGKARADQLIHKAFEGVVAITIVSKRDVTIEVDGLKVAAVVKDEPQKIEVPLGFHVITARAGKRHEVVRKDFDGDQEAKFFQEESNLLLEKVFTLNQHWTEFSHPGGIMGIEVIESQASFVIEMWRVAADGISPRLFHWEIETISHGSLTKSLGEMEPGKYRIYTGPYPWPSDKSMSLKIYRVD